MRIRVFGYRHCPSVHRIMHHATRIPDEMEPDVVFIDVAKHSVTLRDMADRAGCPVDNFPCVFVDDVYLEPLHQNRANRTLHTAEYLVPDMDNRFHSG
ncbi:hypothetical protein [Escherichia coli]|uniref:hypothetical protein n=1 Tax=Escherichia coli TaxID=562 RepID=UPI00207B5615|nr:hypothetical protein [Escherichia coli]